MIVARRVATVVHALLVAALVAAGLVPLREAAAQAVERAAIAARPLARGEVLTADDIVYRDTVIKYPTDTNHVAPGWVTRRVIAMGEVLHAPAVVPPVVVQANQTVAVVWADQNVELIVRGTATRSASLGERVFVRTESGRRFETTVVAPGRVRIE